jgi:peptide deformylase
LNVILKIARMGHPVLRMKAEPVSDPTDDSIAVLVEDMIETMEDANGAGLAAPQVHVPLRIMVFHVPRGRDASPEGGEDRPVGLTVLINPEFEVLDPETSIDFEGCLSLPGMTGQVRRYNHIRYRGVDLNGEMVERAASGFHARVFQHEYDHLDGILYPQRMDDMSTFGYVEEMQKAMTQE